MRELRNRAREKMTSKERVLAALARQQPDRVPIDYGANPGLNDRFMRYFGLDSQNLSHFEQFRQAIGLDFHGFNAPYAGPRLHAEIEGRHVDPAWGIRTAWVEHGAGGYWDYCDFPLQNADEETVANWPLPSPDDYDYDVVYENCSQNGSYAVWTGGAGTPDLINGIGMLRTMEQVFLDLVTEDAAGLLLMDRKVNLQLEVMRRTLEAAKGTIDFIWLGEDLGTQTAPIIGMEVFRRQIRPRQQKFVDLAKSFGLPVMIHCCGSSSWAFDEFVDMGMDAVDTLQPEAFNMSPEYLKSTFGDRLAFHGCISTAGSVSFGTVDDVIAECRRTLDIMRPGGGYCFAPTHALQDNSPTENVVAMYEAANTYGFY